MTTETKAQLVALTAAVQLVDVRLILAQVRTVIRDPASVPKPQMVLSHDTRLASREEKSFIVGARLKLRVVAENEKEPENPPIAMTVVYALEYTAPNVADYAEETLNEFARVNGTFNAWPYWREYVQSTSARMNLPPLVLPVFRLSSTRPDAIPAATERPAPVRGARSKRTRKS